MGEMAPFAVNKLVMRGAEVARRLSVLPSATTKSVVRGRDDNPAKEIQKICFKVLNVNISRASPQIPLLHPVWLIRLVRCTAGATDESLRIIYAARRQARQQRILDRVSQRPADTEFDLSAAEKGRGANSAQLHRKLIWLPGCAPWNRLP